MRAFFLTVFTLVSFAIAAELANVKQAIACDTGNFCDFPDWAQQASSPAIFSVSTGSVTLVRNYDFGVSAQ